MNQRSAGAKRYRDAAARCRISAEETFDPELRRQWLGLAEQYEYLAESGDNARQSASHRTHTRDD
jgi:hypothetical protein